jgi:hypothetical protein
MLCLPMLQVAARPVLSRQAVKPQALFGFGKKDAPADKATAPQYYICECSHLAASATANHPRVCHSGVSASSFKVQASASCCLQLNYPLQKRNGCALVPMVVQALIAGTSTPMVTSRRLLVATGAQCATAPRAGKAMAGPANPPNLCHYRRVPFMSL